MRLSEPMAHYMEVSTKVYETYLKYIAPEDILLYRLFGVNAELLIDHAWGCPHVNKGFEDFAKSWGCTRPLDDKPYS